MSSVSIPDRAIRPEPSRDSFGDALRRIPPLLPIYAALLALTTGVGLLITNVLDGVVAWDTDVIRDLASSRTDTLDTLTKYGTWLSETVTSIAILLLAIVVARLVTHGWTWSVFIAVAVGSEKLLYLISSLIVDRDRPPVPTVGDTYATASFPSGHVGTAITLYGGIALMIGAYTGRKALRNWLLVVAALISGVVAYCRMYRGFHYPTDVIVGAVLGLACLSIAWVGIGRFGPRRGDGAGPHEQHVPPEHLDRAGRV